jgi:transposase
MPKTRAPYPPEFREQIVALYEAGRTIPELAEEFEPAAQTIRNWVLEATARGGSRPRETSSSDGAELARLWREVQQLRLERDILAKAAAWFARETESVPPRSTRS